MKNSNALIIFVAINHLILLGCASHFPKDHLRTDECIEQLEKQIESKPVQTHLDTLDGQKVHLGEFFRLCLMNSPACSLPDKFYYWNSEAKLITSETPNGPALHKIRIYYNYLSACRPDLSDPKKTHGDIAEFYNENGDFMGLAVYAGDGFYFPLPYSKYTGAWNPNAQLDKK